MQSDQHILIQKLDEFIRRYYKNQLIKGALYVAGIVLSVFLSFVLLEYFAEFGNILRATLFFGFIAVSLFVISKYIVLPALKLYRIGAIISYQEAANIIGNHFSSVQDKLVNVLQLQNNQYSNASKEFLVAGINQKINELNPIPFVSAINTKENLKYLKYVGPLFIFFILIAVIWPQIISKSTSRLVNYNRYYAKEMPFEFHLLNNELSTLQSQDFILNLEIKGDELPNEVFIEINKVEYKLEKENNSHFHFTISNPQQDLDFNLMAAGYSSEEYLLKVLPKPSLLQFNLQLIYPAYLKMQNQTVSNTGDIEIPQGTKVKWLFNTKNTEQLKLHFTDTSFTLKQSHDNQFTCSRQFLLSNQYTVKASNQLVSSTGDSVGYNINVIADQSPQIAVSEKSDSLNSKNIYFNGEIKDDYGFTNMLFHFHKTYLDSNGKVVDVSGSYPINISKTNVNQSYYYFLDLEQYQLSSNDKIEYYFEVFDNDGVHGPKSSKTKTMTFKAPSRDEINQNTEKNNGEIKKDLEESIKQTKQLQKDINEISKKINEKKQLGYEEKKKIEDLIKKQNELQKKIEEIKQENERNNKQQSEFSQTDETILEKQQELEKLFENVMTPEMKKLFDELNKLLEKLDKNQVQEKLEELKLSNKDIEKELDRNLEAFKQLEMQEKMQNAIDKLNELKEKEAALNKETEGKKPDEKTQESKKLDDKMQDGKKQDDKMQDGKKQDDKMQDGKKQDDKKQDDKIQDGKKTESLEKKQEDIKQQFEELKKDLKAIEEKNKQLEEPIKLPNTEQKQNEISNELQKSSENLSKNNKKAASQSQKKAEEKMEEMQQEMEKFMADEADQQAEENAESLRQILENLLKLSFSQEALINDLNSTRIDNPKYIDIPKKQNKLKDDSKLIEDSLLALSKRAPSISAIVNREINAIHDNMDKTVKNLAERNVGLSAMNMQESMKSANNLALLLNESLEAMQQQMKKQKENKSQKGGKCKKPGKGSGKNPSNSGQPSSGNLRKMQEQLNKQLQDLKESLEKGNKPGQKPGKEGENGKGQNGKSGLGMPGSSEQFAKMAAQQEAIRRQIESLMGKLKNKGKNPGGDMSQLMEQTEKELVNKRLNTETMRRQQEILTRLLESEKAEKEREQDEKRKSNEAKNQENSNPPQFLEYKRLKEKEMELLNTVPPSLTPYYKEKVNNYFNSVEK
ncbi:MAG: DUF4175 family protein [Bacteroidota bacterium]